MDLEAWRKWMEVGVRKVQWKKIIPYGIAAVIFAALYFGTFRDRTDRLDRQQVQVVAFGDSILGLVRDDTSVLARLEELTGKTVFNAAFGGTHVGRMAGEDMDQAKNSLSLVGLTKSVAADDFGVQQTVRMRESNTQHFADTIDWLEQIDFSKVELVLIQHGVNDYYSGVPIYNEEDPMDEYTYAGALRSSLTALRKVNPDMRILLVTPTYTWYFPNGQTCEEYNVGYGVQEDYIRAQLAVAEEFGVEVLDLFHDLYPHEKWEDWALYTEDGLHPNEAGRELLAHAIAEYLAE